MKENFMKAVVWKAGPESIPLSVRRQEGYYGCCHKKDTSVASLRVDNSEEGEQSSY
jgi:hypothetical protein